MILFTLRQERAMYYPVILGTGNIEPVTIPALGQFLSRTEAINSVRRVYGQSARYLHEKDMEEEVARRQGSEGEVAEWKQPDVEPIYLANGLVIEVPINGKSLDGLQAWAIADGREMREIKIARDHLGEWREVVVKPEQSEEESL